MEKGDRKLNFEIFKSRKRDFGWAFTYDADIICFVIMDRMSKGGRPVVFLNFRAIKLILFDRYLEDEDFDSDLIYFDEAQVLPIDLQSLEPYRLRKFDYYNMALV